MNAECNTQQHTHSAPQRAVKRLETAFPVSIAKPIPAGVFHLNKSKLRARSRLYNGLTVHTYILYTCICAPLPAQHSSYSALSTLFCFYFGVFFDCIESAPSLTCCLQQLWPQSAANQPTPSTAASANSPLHTRSAAAMGSPCVVMPLCDLHARWCKCESVRAYVCVYISAFSDMAYVVMVVCASNAASTRALKR